MLPVTHRQPREARGRPHWRYGGGQATSLWLLVSRKQVGGARHLHVWSPATVEVSRCHRVLAKRRKITCSYWASSNENLTQSLCWVVFFFSKWDNEVCSRFHIEWKALLPTPSPPLPSPPPPFVAADSSFPAGIIHVSRSFPFFLSFCWFSISVSIKRDQFQSIILAAHWFFCLLAEYLCSSSVSGLF